MVREFLPLRVFRCDMERGEEVIAVEENGCRVKKISPKKRYKESPVAFLPGRETEAPSRAMSCGPRGDDI